MVVQKSKNVKKTITIISKINQKTEISYLLLQFNLWLRYNVFALNSLDCT